MSPEHRPPGEQDMFATVDSVEAPVGSSDATFINLYPV